MIRALTMAALLAATGAAAAPADPFRPSPAEAVRLVREHRTNGYVTVARTLAQAGRERRDSFRVSGLYPEQRPGESFTRVRLCYWLRAPGTRAQPLCDITFIVSTNPAHVEPAERFEGLGRDLQDGPQAFLRGLDRELALQRDPAERVRRTVLDPFELYDWR
ncbi:hypothetical protein [Methylobacterium dankookense]|uniref:Uncharacterized protein n=1 Tax=Methylobacterium dankookense TaxID=560405 RepID=A0A564G202_9HYPH|nr:hypothetical protein [Methylobacterium dankookense]GJD59568.1 hypothetical protein IFDJLNFL_5497 [Methylobacterium dankookense]VUF13988.1 hypothetical protein MTDSW087_03698 [Methylobacterium dankookense]